MFNMDTNKANELLFAYAAGCLDREDYPQLFGILNSADSLDFGRQLAEMQNIVSLIPAILEIEHPDQKVKDKVARRLYRLREETRAAKKPLNPKPYLSKDSLNPEISDFSSKPESLKEEILVDDVSLNTQAESQPYQYLPLTPSTAGLADNDKLNDLTNFDQKHNNSNPQTELTPETLSDRSADADELDLAGFNSQKNDFSFQTVPVFMNEDEKQQTAPERKSKKGILYFILTLILCLAASYGIYYFMSMELQKNQSQIVSMNSQIKLLSAELARLEKNQKVMAVLSAGNNQVFNLDGTTANPKGFGKLTVSGEGKEGILQLYNMPELSGNQIYQLWVMKNDQAISMGAFRTKKEIEYFPVEQLPLSQDQISSFILTLEENGESASPSKNVFLSNLLQK